MKTLFLLLLILSSLHTKGQFLVDGFKPEARTINLGLSSGISHFRNFYAAPGKVFIKRTTVINSLYLSAAPTTYLRVAANIPYFNVISGETNSFQDAVVQVQGISPYSLLNLRPYLLFTYSQPLQNYETEIADAIGQQAFIRGYGGGLQWTKDNYFASLSFQAQDKNPPTPSANQYQFRGGYFKNTWFYSLNLDIQKANGGSDYRDGNRQPFTTLGAAFTKLSATTYKRLSNQFGVSVSVGQVLAGRNVGQSTDLFIGLIWNSKI